jgi:hypothetical protein
MRREWSFHTGRLRLDRSPEQLDFVPIRYQIVRTAIALTIAVRAVSPLKPMVKIRSIAREIKHAALKRRAWLRRR